MSQAAALPHMRRLRLSSTMTGYIARVHGTWFAGMMAALVGIILLVSVIDLLDRLAAKENAPLTLVLEMAALKLPFLIQEIMPFVVLFSAMATFWRLTRTHELIVARAAGVSVWQFLLPVLATAIVVGAFTVTVLNPVASAFLSRYESLETKYISRQASTLSVSETGLWLRQSDDRGQSVIHASRVSPEKMTLHHVIVFRFRGRDHFVSRIDARRAQLDDGRWMLLDALHTRPGQPGEQRERMVLETDLTPEKIYESFAPPETISFWSLPGFIDLLENAGFTAHRHRLQLHRLLANPVLFAAMVLLAATFSLRPQRRGRVAIVIAAGVLTAFLLHFLSNFVFALGMSYRLPVVMAAWTPASVTLMLGLASLLHLEDG